MEVNYLLIEEVTYGEPVEHQLLEALLELEFVEVRREPSGTLLIAESSCDNLRTMLRLATVLEVNTAGIETIMHMRRRIADLQGELRRLRKLEASYQLMRPSER